MRLSNLCVARVLWAQNSQAPRSSRTSATNPAAHTILNNKCEDEWTKISGWGLTILFSQLCACEWGDIHNFRIWILCPRTGASTTSIFEFCARVRAAQIVENIGKTSYLGHAWNTNTSRNIAEFQKGKGLAPYLLSPRCALIAHRASPSGFSHFPMGAKRKSWRLIREARRERRM